MANDVKPSNPKDLIGSDKLPFHLWPETATALGCLGLLDGALKYGRANFRAIGVRASIYYDALRRHMNKWFEGEDIDPDSGLPHLAHALACLAILVDAEAAGKLNDDRQYPGGYSEYIQNLTPHVKRLKLKYSNKPSPVHYAHAHATDEYKQAAEGIEKFKAEVKKRWGIKGKEPICSCQTGQDDNLDIIPCDNCKEYWGV